MPQPFPTDYQGQKDLYYDKADGIEFVYVSDGEEVVVGNESIFWAVQETIIEQIRVWEEYDDPRQAPNLLETLCAKDENGHKTPIHPQIIEDEAKKNFKAEWFYYAERFQNEEQQRPRPDDDLEYLVEIGHDNSDDLCDMHDFLHNCHIQLVVNNDYYQMLRHSDGGTGLEEKTLVNGDEVDYEMPAGMVKHSLVLFELPNHEHLLMIEKQNRPAANTIGCFVMPEWQHETTCEQLKYYVDHLQRYLNSDTWAWEVWKDEMSIDYAGRFATPKEALADFLSKFNAREYQIIYNGKDITFDIHDQLNCDIGAESQAESLKKKARGR